MGKIKDREVYLGRVRNEIVGLVNEAYQDGLMTAEDAKWWFGKMYGSGLIVCQELLKDLREWHANARVDKR
jgi:hypothetical protein